LKYILWRITEDQASWFLRNNTPCDEEEVGLIEELVSETKPNNDLVREFERRGYHFLVYSQFRYPPPIPPEYEARFKPPFYSKNVFYGSIELYTSYYEYAYHWMRQRIHLPTVSLTAEERTVFSVSFSDRSIVDIHHHKDIAAIMNKADYAASHKFVKENQHINSILYPSARKVGGKCVSTYDIKNLSKTPKEKDNIRLVFHTKKQDCVIYDSSNQPVTIKWRDVS
jgi:hypothetical protein